MCGNHTPGVDSSGDAVAVSTDKRAVLGVTPGPGAGLWTESPLGDLLKDGIIDPAKVVRTALQNAASVAGLLLTNEAAVADRPRRSTRCPPMPAMPDYGISRGSGTRLIHRGFAERLAKLRISFSLSGSAFRSARCCGPRRSTPG